MFNGPRIKSWEAPALRCLAGKATGDMPRSALNVFPSTTLDERSFTHRFQEQYILLSSPDRFPEEEGFLHTVFTCLQYAVPHRAHMHIWCRRVRGYAAHDKLGTCSSVQVRSCNHTVAVALNTDRKQSCVYIARTFQAPLASVAAE